MLWAHISSLCNLQKRTTVYLYWIIRQNTWKDLPKVVLEEKESYYRLLSNVNKLRVSRERVDLKQEKKTSLTLKCGPSSRRILQSHWDLLFFSLGKWWNDKSGLFLRLFVHLGTQQTSAAILDFWSRACLASLWFSRQIILRIPNTAL